MADLAEPYDAKRDWQQIDRPQLQAAPLRKTTLKPEVVDMMLTTAVRLALHPEREEASLQEIARKLGELGELKLMTDMWAHVERLETCLRMGESNSAAS